MSAATYTPDLDPALLIASDQHAGLREAVRDLLRRELPDNGPDGPEPRVWQLLVEQLGIGGLLVPEEHGGLGLGLRDAAVVLEEAGRALLPGPLLGSVVLATTVITRLASAADAAELLPALAAGELTIALDHTGPLPARVDTDGRPSLTGETAPIPLAEAADLVLLITAEAGAVLVDTRNEAVTVVPVETLDPTRPRARLRLDGAPARVLVPAARGAELRELLAALVPAAVAAEQVGMADRLLEMLREYLTTREQFGRPIGSFQAIKHRMADLLVAVERARSAMLAAVATADAEPARAPLAAAVAGAVCIETALLAAHESVQLHGGIGFTWEHPAHRYLRRALDAESLVGGAHGQRRRIAELLGLLPTRTPPSPTGKDQR